MSLTQAERICDTDNRNRMRRAFVGAMNGGDEASPTTGGTSYGTSSCAGLARMETLTRPRNSSRLAILYIRVLFPCWFCFLHNRR